MALVKTDVSEERIASLVRKLQLLVTANVLSSLILSALMMEAMISSGTSVSTRITRHHISEDGILQYT
jgi:hypothetical protein